MSILHVQNAHVEWFQGGKFVRYCRAEARFNVVAASADVCRDRPTTNNADENRN